MQPGKVRELLLRNSARSAFCPKSLRKSLASGQQILALPFHKCWGVVLAYFEYTDYTYQLVLLPWARCQLQRASWPVAFSGTITGACTSPIARATSQPGT